MVGFAAKMTSHVGAVYDCAETVAKNSPVDASVLACEVYGLLSNLKLLPPMDVPDLGKADVQGLANPADALEQGTSRI